MDAKILRYCLVIICLVGLTSCQTLITKKNLRLKKGSTLEEFRNAGIGYDDHIVLKVLSEYKKATFEVYTTTIPGPYGTDEYYYAFQDGKLIYWGYPYQFNRHDNSLMREIGEETQRIVKSKAPEPEDTDKVRLEAGVGVSLAGIAISSLHSKNSFSNPINFNGFGVGYDYLNEYTAYGLIKVNKSIGFGLEGGRLSYYEVVGTGVEYKSIGGTEEFTRSVYLSGIYFAPYLKYKQLSIGLTYMSPSEESYFQKDDNKATRVLYAELTPNEQIILKNALQSYLNVFIKYDFRLDKFFGTPSSIYCKFAKDLGYPIDYGTYPSGPLEDHKRHSLAIGLSIGFNLIK